MNQSSKVPKSQLGYCLELWSSKEGVVETFGMWMNNKKTKDLSNFSLLYLS